jgi:hypothetical protein
MPKPFFRLTLSQFQLLLNSYPFERKINAIHMHHTWRPRRSDYQGAPTIEAIWRFHTEFNHWTDIAEHITIAPDGVIWTGRDWNRAPASAAGFNGNDAVGPFMFEIIGDFDLGAESLDGDQRDVVISVIASLCDRFELSPEDLHFHDQMTNKKTCPGSSLDRGNIVQDVRSSLEGHAAEPETTDKPAAVNGTADQAFIAQVIASMTRGVKAVPEQDAEPEYTSLAERAFMRARDPLQSVESGIAAGLTRDLDPASFERLRPYAINIRRGQFATGDGHLLQTSSGDVDAIFDQYLPRELARAAANNRPLNILFYAHGGLVSEKDGLTDALYALDFYLDNNVYPIFFIWETGFWEDVGDLVSGAVEPQARDLAAVADSIRNKAIEYSAHYALGGPRIWGGMKGSAEMASADKGAATYVAQKLKSFVASAGSQSNVIRLHATGHSAGSIFHSQFLPRLFKLGNPALESMHFLAPAIRADSYKDRLMSLVGSGNKIKQLTMYTMAKSYELRDTCKRIYTHSLLYLIHDALEDEIGTPILGLEESLRSDSTLVSHFGLGGGSSAPASVVFSVTKEDKGKDASQSVCHGGFHNDPATMNSMIRRILNVSDDQSIREFVKPSADICPDANKSARLVVQRDVISPPFARTAWARPLYRRFGRRVALCIGINNYPNARLGGCVADANAWGNALRQMNFTVSVMQDEACTYSNLAVAIKEMIGSATTGDTLVLQYSGHGTLIADPDRVAGDGEISGNDESLVPIDYETGAFLIDREVGSIFDQLAPGTSLTCFIDCCHSGTISRFAVGTALDDSSYRATKRARFIPFTRELLSAYRGFQQRTGKDVFPLRDRSQMRHVVFSACRAEEVAYESNGQGEFTRRAIPILAGPLSGASNRTFQQEVEQAFGPNPQQHPVLDCASGWEDLPILCAAMGRPTPLDAGIGMEATGQEKLANIASELRALASALEKR